MSDGSRLRQSWYTALNDAETHFRQLLTSSSSADWKRVTNSGEGSPSKKGKARVASVPDLADVVVHRNSSLPGDDVYRLVLDVCTGEDAVSLEPWKTVLCTPELRSEWDPAVEDAHLLEVFDHTTRICKTNFTLGWPANPRDAVTISRSFHDPSTVIDISTSLPRSSDEPAYLRPSPPYVRSNVTLFAWCIQYVQPQQPPPPGEQKDQSKKKSYLGGRIRITCFWQHDLKALWGFSSSSGITQQLSTMTLGLLKTVLKRGGRVPKLIGYGNGVTIERVQFQIDREALTIDYMIIPEDSEEHHLPSESSHGLDELHALREQRRLTRSVECLLPSSEGWDVQVSTKASSEEVAQLPWTATAIRSTSHPASSQPSSSQLDQIVLRLSHTALIDDHSVLKVRVVIEISGPSSGLRLNGLPQTIQDIEDRDPSSYFISKQILQDVSSTADLSFNTSSSMATVNSGASSAPSLVRTHADRSAAAEKSVSSRVRRNYIYFSSLLQEPEAKWRRTTEARGVSITQLDSIDPTLVVYRAEATFVGVGLWDLYGAVVSPGAKIFWDKQHEDAVLLEDVSELTELWHFKTRPAWPVNGRDSVVLKTVYKSPTTIHVFSFSAEDPHLFPNIPPVEPNVIRTQVDLQGWAIEALSPTTTLLTLLEQSDPKGWTNKTSIPTQMINSLAGIGDFAIKCGGPPVVTRLAGARANELRYDHERGSFRVEYEASASRRTPSSGADPANGGTSLALPVIECELRCDIDTWAHSLDIVVDPPPQTISCLRRHRLSSEGGGLWLSLTHDALFVDDDRLLTIVRRAPGKERGLVMVNGAKVNIDVEELPEAEIKSLSKRKRVKPPRIPLDQPPVVGVIRRRRAEWDADSEGSPGGADSPRLANISTNGWASAPRISSPLTRFFTYAVDQAATTTQQAVAAISPAGAAGVAGTPSSSKMPMQYALEALAWTQEAHSRSSMDGWTLVSEKGMPVHRKIVPEISAVVPVHKGFKVIEGVSAEELAAVVTEQDCRKKWDDRFDSTTVFESFGGECRTSFLVSKGGFPFRDRGFYLASVMARAHVPASLSRRSTGEVAEQSNGARNAIFCVSASFSPDSVASFSPAKYNSYGLPIGRMYVDAWILETLDPYTKENYAIPSTRCTRLVAVDYAGSIPAAVNSMINATIPRSILAVETYIKSISPLPITRLPTPGLVITDRKVDENFMSTAWRLRRRDDARVLVNSKYHTEERVYMTTILLLGISPAARSPITATAATVTASATSPELTPKASKMMPVSISTPQTRFPDPPDVALPSNVGSLPGVGDGLPGSPPPPTSPAVHHRTRSSSSARDTSMLRGRASSSAFTVKGEVRPSTDLLVAEVVIDSKLYPDGYTVTLRSRMRTSSKVGIRGQQISLRRKEGDVECVLPLAHTIHTMPSSPLHSSGLNAESPTRHLLRLSLPTAQYQISTVKDPLTGETQSAPPKPGWLVEMQEGGAIVDVEIRPAKKGSKAVVSVDGVEVAVVSDKESLTSLGREELLDDRVSKMSVLTRMPSEAEPLPDELKIPVALADDLLDASGVSVSTPDGQDSKEPEESSAKPESTEDLLIAPSDPPPTPHPPHAAPSGLLGFLQAYPNPLTRFTTTTTSVASTPVPGNASTATATPPRKVPGGLGDIDAVANAHPVTLFPLSTVLVVALIAFLIGSLLRSLLTPADFIYVVTDLREAEEAGSIGGWREIRRLVEVKYIVGGWDFQIAVVRRH